MADPNDALLLEAVKNGDVDRATELVTSGADIEQVGKYGYTLLHTSARYPNDHTLEMIRFLLANGADILQRNRFGQRASAVAEDEQGWLVEHCSNSRRGLNQYEICGKAALVLSFAKQRCRKIERIGEWRPSNADQFPAGYKNGLRTLLMLARA